MKTAGSNSRGYEPHGGLGDVRNAGEAPLVKKQEVPKGETGHRLRPDVRAGSDLPRSASKMRVVFFVLKGPWYDEIEAGRKRIEYRAVTPYWTARLCGKKITHAIFSRGYSRRNRLLRRVTKIDIGPCPYPGWNGRFYRVHLQEIP
jgi:hypothetical protein